MFQFIKKAITIFKTKASGLKHQLNVPSEAVFRIRVRIRIHRIHMFFDLPDPDPLVWGMDPDPALIWVRILLSSCKINKKNLDYYYFVTLFDFLSSKNNVNVPSKKNKQRKLC